MASGSIVAELSLLPRLLSGFYRRNPGVSGLKCPECGSSLVKVDHEVVCGSCGRVVDDLELVPAIPPRERDPGIWDFATFKNSSLRLHGSEISEKDTLLLIKHICSMLRLPSSVEGDAGRILVLLRKRGYKFTVREVAAVAVYIAAKLAQVPISFGEIVKVAGVLGGENKLFSIANEAIPAIADKIKIKPLAPDKYIPRIVAKIDAQEQYRNAIATWAVEIAKQLWESTVFKGRNPLMVAALAVAYADECYEGAIGPKAVAKASGISSQTISNHLARLRKHPPKLPPFFRNSPSFELFMEKLFVEM